MERPWKVIAAFIGVFVAGAVFGGFFTLRTPSRRPAQQQAFVPLPANQQQRPQVAGPQSGAPTAPGRGAGAPQYNTREVELIQRQLMRQFSKTLKLEPEQKEKLQPIVGRAGEDFQRLREEEARRRQEHLADVARVNERMYVDVSNLLTPEQRLELQAIRQEVEERIQAERQKRAEAAAEAAANRASKGAERPATAKQPPENPK